MFGFYNMVLRVNLTHQSFELKMISDQVLCATLGGKGLAAYLFRESKPDQSSTPTPSDSLIFATGPVTGNTVPGALCCGAFTRPPKGNGCFAHYYCGTIAEYVGGTGFDAVMVNGASDKPLWIEVCEGGGFFHSAVELQGLNAIQTAKRIEAWMRENQPAARKFGIVCVGDDGQRSSEPLSDFWAVDRKSDMARLLLARKVWAIVFWGGKKRILAHPGLISRFASKARAVALAGDRPVPSGAASEPEMEDRRVIYDSLIVGDSYRHLYGWEDLGLLIKGATGLELGRVALRSIARSIMEDIEHLT
jgi:aldehyde:ferredoxin oxidoreductase